MPSVTITLTDTPAGGIAVHSDFKPAIGTPCSAAQSAALDAINRINRDWNTAHLIGQADAVPTRDRCFAAGQTQ